MHFSEEKSMTINTFSKKREISVGDYETVRKNGQCLWIDDELCIDLDTLKVLYRKK